jgi:lipopolysaccharide assembly outer membrane protein LptD (OstA)
MKPVALAMCLIASSAFAQDLPPATGGFRFEMVPPPSLAPAVPDSAGQPTLIVTANSAEVDQANRAIVRLKGDVQIESGGVIVKADEAVCNFATGEIEPLGNVRAKLIKQ